MSREQTTQTLAPEAKQELRAVDPPHRLFDVNNPSPLVGATVLAEVFAIGVSQVHKNAKRGLYEMFEVKPALGPKRWSGILLAQYLKGRPLYVPTFGARRKRA